MYYIYTSYIGNLCGKSTPEKITYFPTHKRKANYGIKLYVTGSYSTDYA